MVPQWYNEYRINSCNVYCSCYVPVIAKRATGAPLDNDEDGIRLPDFMTASPTVHMDLRRFDRPADVRPAARSN